MRKMQDIIWEESTLWESIERWVVQYLKKNHTEYQEMQSQAIGLVENNPALWQLMNEAEGVTLTGENHKTLHNYFELKSGMETFELEYYFFAGQMMTFSYGSMLARLKEEIFEPDEKTSTHLIELLAAIRSDEIEEQLQEENAEYRERIEEEKRCEEELQKMKLSRAERKAIDRYVTAVNNRWLLCGDQLYRAGMKDVLLLLENR